MSARESKKPAVSRIPVSGPWITAKEIAYVTDAVTNAWYDGANQFHDRFEKAFATHLGMRFTTSLPSCTSAIHLALAALGIGPGDEVIVPDVTWIASAAPIAYVGATPVFADIDRKSWCIDPKSVEACITEHTRAIIPVDLYGNMADYPRLRELADKHEFAIIEDAAEAVGATRNNKPAGSFGDVGVFSFHGSKTLTTGEGGLLSTNDPDIFRRVMQLRDHGRKPGDRFFFNAEVGFKYKMSSMQAALGLAQLERVEELVARKREIFQWYSEEFEDLPGVILNHEERGTRSAYWMSTMVWDTSFGWTKIALQEALSREGVDSRPFFHPLSFIPAYREQPQAATARLRNKVSYDISPRALNLPSALNLDRDQVHRVVHAIKRLFRTGPPR